MATTFRGRKFDRIYRYDVRNEHYQLAPRRGERASKTWDCSKHINQGSEGSCVGHGCGHELVADPVPVLTIDHDYCRKNIYWEAQKNDDWPGGDYPGAWPRYEGTSVLAGLKVLQKKGWCDEYKWASGVDDVYDGIADGPFIMGTNWYSGMMDTDKNGFIKPSGDVVGGHCWLLKGVNFEESYIIGHNSWGEGWGIGGDFKITFDDFKTLMETEGEAAQLVGRHETGNEEPDDDDTKTFWQWLWEFILSLFGQK